MEKSATYWMLEPLRKYASFSGRARRREYWWYQVLTAIVVTVLMIIDAVVFGVNWWAYDGAAGPLATFAALFFVIPNLAVSVRRLHDRDKSGWWVLIAVFPLIGFLFLFYQYISAGTPGDNQYGPDPKAGEG